MAVVEIKNRIWTLHELQRTHAGDIVTAENRGRPLTAGHRSMEFGNPLNLFIATTQPKKIEEMTAPLAAQSKNIVVMPAQDPLGYWRCDPEESGTYMGNAAGKAIALLDRIYNSKTGIGIEKVRENLRAEGFDPDNAVFIVNDTGVAFQRDYRHEPEFAASIHVGGPVAWPGPEFAPVVEAQGGIVSFFASLKQMAARLEAEGKPVLLKGFDVATNLCVRLGKTREETQFVSFTASIPVEFTLDPLSHAGEVLTTQHFMKLRGDDVPAALQDKSIAQIKPDYLAHHGPIAHAMHELSRYANVPVTMQPKFLAAAVAQDIAVATQNDFLKSQVGQGTIDRVAAQSHAVVLHEHAPETLADWDNNFLSHMDLWCGLLVNKQVCDKSIHGKPVIVMQREGNKFYERFEQGEMNWDDPKTERDFLQFLDDIDPSEDPWLKLRMLTRFKHEKGMVKQEEHHLFACVDPSMADQSTVTGLVQDLVHQDVVGGKCAKRGAIAPRTRESFGEDRRDLFEVFIAGSASTYAQSYVDAAEELGYWAASQGFHVRTGGGSMGIMGAAARGVFRFIQENPDMAEDTHLSLVQTFSTMRFEGAAIDPDKVETMPNVYLAVESCFDTRMASLFRCAGADMADPSIGAANVIMMGGIGTLQEANRWMQYKESGVPHMQDKKLIYFNQRQASDTTGRQIRVLDPDIRVLPKEIREAHIEQQFDLQGVKASISRQHAEWVRANDPVVMPSVFTRPSLQL